MDAPARLMVKNDGRLNFHSSCGTGHHVSNANNFACQRNVSCQCQKYRDGSGRVNAFPLSRAFGRRTCTQKTTLSFHIAAQKGLATPVSAVRVGCSSAPPAAVQHPFRPSGTSVAKPFLTGGALSVVSRRNAAEHNTQIGSAAGRKLVADRVAQVGKFRVLTRIIFIA
jgi:hypothetical protein